MTANLNDYKNSKACSYLIVAGWVQLITTVLMIPYCIVYFEQITKLKTSSTCHSKGSTMWPCRLWYTWKMLQLGINSKDKF